MGRHVCDVMRIQDAVRRLLYENINGRTLVQDVLSMLIEKSGIATLCSFLPSLRVRYGTLCALGRGSVMPDGDSPKTPVKIQGHGRHALQLFHRVD